MVLYFYDLLITGSCISDIGPIKYSLHSAFSMTGLGPLLKQFLVLKIEQSYASIKVSQ